MNKEFIVSSNIVVSIEDDNFCILKNRIEYKYYFADTYKVVFDKSSKKVEQHWFMYIINLFFLTAPTTNEIRCDILKIYADSNSISGAHALTGTINYDTIYDVVDVINEKI
jgi:hypothetical protein